MTLQEQLREIWTELYPSDAWVDAEFALRFMAGDLKGMRLHRGTLRQAAEVQRAHDLLRSVLTHDHLRDLIFTSNTYLGDAVVIENIFCWVLQHDHHDGGRATAEYLRVLERQCMVLGYPMRDKGHDVP
jgi:hypothetical protein